MSSITERFDVVCPRCGEEYAVWYRQALGTCMPSTCPHCDYELLTDLTVQSEGVWSLSPDDGDPVRQ